MNKKEYQKPAIRSVGMQHRTQMILQSGGFPQGVSSKRTDYGVANKSLDTSPGSGITLDGNGRWVWN